MLDRCEWDCEMSVVGEIALTRPSERMAAEARQGSLLETIVNGPGQMKFNFVGRAGEPFSCIQELEALRLPFATLGVATGG